MDDQEFTTMLRERGYRVTPQRMAILKVLRDRATHMTPLEVYHHVREQMPGMTEATVYRTLNFLAEEKLVLCGHIGGGQLIYEASNLDHHHLICRKCGQEIMIYDDLMQEFFDRLGEETGYVLDSQHVTLFGVCALCRQ